MKPKPSAHSLYRYIGPGNGHGKVHRVVYSAPYEVVTIEETEPAGMFYHPVPHFSWLGSVENFHINFVFYTGPTVCSRRPPPPGSISQRGF